MLVKNPDSNKIYHVWHYCDCGQTFTHSQGSWESMKIHVRVKHKDNWDWIHDVSTNIESVELKK